MSKLPNTKLSDRELWGMINDKLFGYGGEAVVCKNNNPHTLYKIFTRTGTNIPEGMSENKFQKILRLHENPVEHLVRPIGTISNQGVLIGYEMTYDQDDQALINKITSYDEKKYYLKETQKILDYLNERDIIYGDIKDDNVLINEKTGLITLCDIDNIQIEELPIDLMNYALEQYYDQVGEIDDKVDAYMHNLFFLEQLRYEGLSYAAILRRLAARPIMPEFPEEVQEIIDTLIYPEDFKGEYAIQYIKK